MSTVRQTIQTTPKGNGQWQLWGMPTGEYRSHRVGYDASATAPVLHAVVCASAESGTTGNPCRDDRGLQVTPSVSGEPVPSVRSESAISRGKAGNRLQCQRERQHEGC